MIKVVNIKQGGKKWLDYRSSRIGASEVAALLGLHKYVTRRELLARKLGLGKSSTNAAMQRGHEREREIMEYAAKALDVPSLDPIVLQHPDYDYICASLDGFANFGGHRIVVDAKCYGDENYFNALTGSLPHYVYCQLQMQMLLAEADTGYAAIGHQEDGFEHFILPVEPNREAQMILVEECALFHDELESYRSGKRDFYDEIDMDAEIRYIAAKTAMDEAEKELKQAKAELLEKARKKHPHGDIHCRGFTISTVKTSRKQYAKDAPFTTKESSYDRISDRKK